MRAGAIGPEAACARVAGWLQGRLGDREWMDAHAARHGYDLAADPLPTAALVVPHDPGPVALEDWPAVAVTCGGSTLQLLDADEDGELYRVTYTLRVLLLVRSEDDPMTTRLSQRYTLAAREALLSVKSLGSPAGQILAASLSESLSPTSPGDGDVVAGSQLAVTFVAEERHLTHGALGRVAQVVVDTTALPPHPAL